MRWRNGSTVASFYRIATPFFGPPAPKSVEDSPAWNRRPITTFAEAATAVPSNRSDAAGAGQTGDRLAPARRTPGDRLERGTGDPQRQGEGYRGATTAKREEAGEDARVVSD